MATPEEAPLIDGFKKYNRTISTDICPCCGEVLESDASAMVECENCLRWFHFTCVNYTNNYGPNDKYFCDTCIFLNTKRMLSDLQTIPPFSSKRYPDVQKKVPKKANEKTPGSAPGITVAKLKTNSMDNSIPKKHDKSCLVKQEPFHSLSGPSGSYSYAYGSNEYKHLHGSSDVGMGRNSFVGRDSIEENPFRDTYDYSLDKDKPCRNNLFYVRKTSLPYSYLTKHQKASYKRNLQELLNEPSEVNVPKDTMQFIKRVKDILDNKVILDIQDPSRAPRKMSRSSNPVQRHNPGKPVPHSFFNSQTPATPATPSSQATASNTSLFRPSTSAGTSPSVTAPASGSPLVSPNINHNTTPSLFSSQSKPSSSPSTLFSSHSTTSSPNLTNALKTSSTSTPVLDIPRRVTLTVAPTTKPEGTTSSQTSSTLATNPSLKPASSSVPSSTTTSTSTSFPSTATSTTTTPPITTPSTTKPPGSTEMTNHSYPSHYMSMYPNNYSSMSSASMYPSSSYPMMPMQSGTYNYPMNYSYSSMPQDPKSKPSTTTSNDPNDKNAMNHMNYNQYMYNYNYHYPYRATGSMKEEDKFSNRKPSFSENDSSMKRKDYNTSSYKSNSKYSENNSSSHYYSNSYSYSMNKMSSKDKDGNNYRNNSTRYENKRDYYENGNNSYYHYSNSSSTTNGSYNESSNPPSNSHPKYYKSYDGTYKKSRFDDKT